MRIVVDNSGYHLRNMGDVSMLQVATHRLRSRLPGCQIAALTTAPDRLEKFTGCRAVDPLGRVRWNRANILPKRPRWIPDQVENYILRNEFTVREFRPRLANQLATVSEMIHFKRPGLAAEFPREISRADLVVATGGGYFTDAFEAEALEILQTLALGIRFGKPTVLLGQGLGPVTSQRLLDQMADVLPRLDLITLRESRAGGPLLRKLGVPSERVLRTGDDAVEFAHLFRPRVLGDDLGVNVRLSYYSGVDDDDRRAFSEAIGAYLSATGRRARVIPISFHGHENDGGATRALLDPAHLVEDHAIEETPDSIINTVGHCRLVVTGSYHAAVFALSQGIPVIGWARSPYYVDKFHGLAEMFGPGCIPIEMGGHALRESLFATLMDIDAKAETLRETLLAAAEDQIRRGNEAYDLVSQLCKGVHS